METKRNHLMPIILFVIFLLIIGLGVAFYFYFSQPKSTIISPSTSMSKPSIEENFPQEAPIKENSQDNPPTVSQSKLLGTHNVARGDTLWWISDKWYQDPILWPYIFEINRSLIKDPDRIYPGQRFDILAFSRNDDGQLSPQDYTLLSQGYLEAYRIYKEKGVKSAQDYRIMGEFYDQKAKKSN